MRKLTRVQRVSYQAISCFTNYVKDYRDMCGHFQLEQDFKMDSLDRVEILLCLEEDFDIEIPHMVCDEWYIVDDIVNSVIQAGGK